MHIPTTALFAITLSIIGISKSVCASRTSDALGAKEFAFKCRGRLYPKNYIYYVAQRFCELIDTKPLLRDRSFSEAGYRPNYPNNTLGDARRLLTPGHDAVPILVDGSWFPFDLEPNLRFRKNHAGKNIEIKAGSDRLIIDKYCVIRGAITEIDAGLRSYRSIRIQQCIDLRSETDYISYAPEFPRPFSINPENIQEIPLEEPPKRLREQSRENIPEIPPEKPSKRLREQSPERNI